MPTYEYQCKNCGHAFEEMQSMAADPLMVCPTCGRPSLKRLLTGGTGMIFKGSGFYQTDYKNSGSGGKKTEKPASPTSQTKTKEDSKPSSDASQTKKTDS